MFVDDDDEDCFLFFVAAKPQGALGFSLFVGAAVCAPHASWAWLPIADVAPIRRFELYTRASRPQVQVVANVFHGHVPNDVKIHIFSSLPACGHQVAMINHVPRLVNGRQVQEVSPDHDAELSAVRVVVVDTQP